MSRRLIDLSFLIWTIVWVALAIQVAIDVRGLRDLSTTVQRTGEAVQESGQALEQLNGLPLVGAELGGPAKRIQRAGESAVQSGKSSRDSIRDLSVLLALAIGVIPPVALLGVFLSLRRRQPGPRRTERAVREVL